jgi:DNA-binding ferritin-like protein
MDFTSGYKLKKPAGSVGSSSSSLEGKTAACVSELMNAATSFHKLHLKVTGLGSFAAHKALNELYDALPGHADDLAEGFQGACEKLLNYEDSAPRILNSAEEALSYIRDIYQMVNGLQAVMPYTEIVNDLDAIKSTLNGIKYKLLFLK